MRSRRHLETHDPEPLRPSDLAAVAGLSASRFSRAFHAAFGASPIEHLIQVRLEAAREKLLFTVFPTRGIAFGVGFPDALHFSKVFTRARVGGSGPSNGANKHRTGQDLPFTRPGCRPMLTPEREVLRESWPNSVHRPHGVLMRFSIGAENRASGHPESLFGKTLEEVGRMGVGPSMDCAIHGNYLYSIGEGKLRISRHA
ncbi:MAG: helix-turn-helix transcriptional regulator [Spirochaetes bacterium]|nr:helix-turn-helix transcriptional regulator [Spirochaetota bacterium]